MDRSIKPIRAISHRIARLRKPTKLPREIEVLTGYDFVFWRQSSPRLLGQPRSMSVDVAEAGSHQ
jgi:hypothetical protein